MSELAVREATEIQAQRPELLRPIAAVGEIIEAHKAVTAIIQQALEQGRDYGVIPGTKDKPSLFKAGGERLLLSFGAYADYTILEHEADHDRPVQYSKRKKQWNNSRPGDKSFIWTEETGETRGLYRYVVGAKIILRGSGQTIGSGIGTCSTLETKYVDRPRDCENTVLKMAEKRAMVAAVLNAFALSDRFTQDVEDYAPAAPDTAGDFTTAPEPAPRPRKAAPAPAETPEHPRTAGPRLRPLADCQAMLRQLFYDSGFNGYDVDERMEIICAIEPEADQREIIRETGKGLKEGAIKPPDAFEPVMPDGAEEVTE